MQDYITLYDGKGAFLGRIREVIDAQYTDRITGELTLSFTTKINRIPAISADTLIEFKGQYFRAVQTQSSAADGAYLLSVSCEQESVALVDDEIELFEFEGTPQTGLIRLLSGTGVSAESEFTQEISVREENTNRRAVVLVIAGVCGAEIEYSGHAVRLVQHRGRSSPAGNLLDILDCTDVVKTADVRSGVESYEISGAKPEGISVGDEVYVTFGPLGIAVQKRIIGISYNPFNCTSVSVEVGEFVPDIIEGYSKAAEEAENAAERVEKVEESLSGYVKEEELDSTVSASFDKYVNSETGKASIVASLKGTYVSADTLGSYVQKTDLSAEIGAYIDTQAGTAKIVNQLTGTFAKTDALGSYVQKTDLSAEIGAYIDTQAGTAKIVDKLTGTFAKTDALGSYVAKSDLSAGIESYIDTTTGKAKLVSAVSGTYVSQTNLNSTLGDYAKKDDIPDVAGFVEKTELSAEIGAYIDTQAGTAKIVDKLTGTFAKTDALGSYVAKSDLSAGIESYIDTTTGKAKLVSAVSGTYITNDNLSSVLGGYALKTDIPSLSGYLLKSEVNASIESYVETTKGKASIVSAVSGTYVTQTNFTNTLNNYPTETELNTALSSYVKTTNLNSSIGTYIDSTTGKAKVVSACSGTYITASDLSGYAKTSAVSEIEQSVSDVEAAITLSSTYTKNTIGTNVYALLQLVSNANSSSIKIKADKIDFTGFTTFLKASDLGSSGSTTIDGGRITTGTISADRIDVTKLKVNTIYGKGTYSTYVAMTTNSTNLYIGGESFAPSYSDIYLAAKDKIYFGSTGIFEMCVDTSSKSIYSTASSSMCGTSADPWSEIHGGGTTSYHIVIADTVIRPSASSTYSTYSLGTSTYPWNAVYTKKLYLNGTELKTGGSLAGTAVTMGGSTSYYIQATTSRQLCPNSSSTTYPFYLGTSSYYWHYAYIGSVQTIIGSGSTSKLGFFGNTGAARQTVSSSATVATLITALKAYGLIY